MTATTWGRLRRHRGGQAGIALAAAVTAAGVLGPLTGHDPNQPDYANQLAAPGAAHWLGTDDAGRDQLARTLAGTRTSLQAVAVVVALTTATGLLVGGIAGYVRGLVDAAVGRLIDVMLGLPGQIVALAVVGALGAGSGNLVLAVVVGGWAYPARVARAAVLGSHDRLEVLAARLAGIPDRRIFATHVLPATVATVAVAAATGVGEVVLILAGLSFLGLGAQPPTAELGQMLADSQSALASSPWLLVGPSVVIAAMVTAALLLSDALRDAADPAAPAPTRGSPPRRRWPPAAPRPRSPHAATAGVRRAPPAAALSVRDLTVTYADGSRAVRGVSLALDSGTCLAVVGESGCGKTSLSR
ncbi:MAG TPA: ABC transporter permease subunit, partial [Pilimelia sp.]|nr:ABC transporter permease subunit [Pilimelia sp.]